MNFVKIRTLPDGEMQLINLDAVKRITKETHSNNETRYELVLSGADIKIDKKEAKKIFEIIGTSL